MYRLHGISTPLLVWGIGLLACGSLLLRFGLPLSNNAVARASRLMPLSARSLEAAPRGSEAMVQGRVSVENPIRAGELVAYRHERFRKTYESWEPFEQVTPALILETQDGAIRIADGSYSIENPTDGVRNSVDRYEGFRRGDTLLAIGSVVETGGLASLDADFVYRGTRDDYLVDRRRHHAVNLWIGPLLLSVGGVLVIASIVLRIWKRISERASHAPEVPAHP